MSKMPSGHRFVPSNTPFYFFHIPKTAGTSLNKILETLFAEKEICPPHLWHELLHFSQEELRQFKLFRGHFYSYLNILIDTPMRSFVFLRDPVERALSYYGHVVGDSSHYLHGRAKDLVSFEAFLRDPVTRETVHNFQARCLVQKFNPIEIAENLSAAELNSFELEKITETTPTELSDIQLLNASKKELDNFCVVGISEKFDESLILLAKTFDWKIPELDGKFNVNQARLKATDITQVERDLLFELNSVDTGLYRYACSLFNEQVSAISNCKSAATSSFISYAQNFEDVILWRALKHIEHGFYIDVGAWSPDIDSVTRAFYERGWQGINIEPNPEFHDQLQKRRSRDQNLRLAIGDREGALTMNFLGNPGLSTFDDAIAVKHQQAGWSLDRQEVQVTTLAALWQQHVPVGQDVHFLKVDVEGFEDAVLRGNDWTKNRPWIVVVEATLPMSPVESHEAWEPILLAANYLFAYADGLNRFYVASERAALLPTFKYPPNVFDDFILSRTQQAEARADTAEARADTAEARTTQAEARLADILNSKTWHLTAPLRWAIRRFRALQSKLR